MFEYVLKSNYGYGWEDECFYNTLEEATGDLKRYSENCPNGVFKVIKRRIKRD